MRPKLSPEDCIAKARALNPEASPSELLKAAAEVARGAELAPSLDAQLRSVLSDLTYDLQKALEFAEQADKSDADEVVRDELREEALISIERAGLLFVDIHVLVGKLKQERKVGNG